MANPIGCQHCGDESPDDARFCISCGVVLTSAVTGPTVRLGALECSDCYAGNLTDSLFCENCGRCLNADSRAYAQPSLSLSPQQQGRDEMADDVPIVLKALAVVFEIISVLA